MPSYSISGISFSFQSAIHFNGHVVFPHFIFSSNEPNGVQIYRAALDGGELIQKIYAMDEGIELELAFHNTSAISLRVERLVLLHTEDLRLGDLPSTEWFFFRQGRMKNELPAVCRLGDQGECFQDACTSLRESGDGTEALSKKPTLISDSMTLINGGNSLLLTFETGDRLFTETILELTASHDFHSLECACPVYAEVLPGQTLVSERLRVSVVSDPQKAIDAYAHRKAERYHARKSRHVPSVYCTWYYYGLTVSEADVLENLAAIQERQIPFEVFQVDEGWEQCLGDWQSNARFPSGMQEIAHKIQEAGMIPGIWTSPFIAHENAPITSLHPEWFLHHMDGSWCLFPMNGTVYRVLDITRPAAVEWAAALYTQLREWGYRYHKLDFTRAAILYEDAPRFRPDLPLVQAYRQAVLRIREEIGQDAYFLMCGGLYDPLIGIVDAQRTGSDVLSMWSAKVGSGGGKTAPFTMKQNLLRYWMHPFWDADPDALMIRRQNTPFRNLNLSLGLLNDDEARTSVLNQFMGGGLACSTEPMRQIEDDRLWMLRHVLPVYPGIPHPRDFLSGSRYPACVDLTYPGYHMVCLINWSDTDAIPCTLRLNYDLLGDFVHVSETYTVCDFWHQSYQEHVPRDTEITLGVIPPHGTALLKILPQHAAPAVLTSTGHFSMGAEFSCLTIEEETLILDMDWKFPCSVRYGIRLPQGYHPVSLPAGTNTFGNLLEIYLERLGHYHFQIPLKRN